MLGKTREKGDFGKRIRGLGEQSLGEFPPGLVDQRLEGVASIGQSSLQRAALGVAATAGMLLGEPTGLQRLCPWIRFPRIRFGAVAAANKAPLIRAL